MISQQEQGGKKAGVHTAQPRAHGEHVLAASIKAPSTGAASASLHSDIEPKPSALSKFFFFLNESVPLDKIRADESDYYLKQKRLKAKVLRQSVIILALTLILLITGPFLRPINIHQAISPSPEKIKQPLIALIEPNMTDQAILSWVATTITEVLTFGFGDFDQRIISQRDRFTDEGWESFVTVVREQDMREDFKSGQLVLTSIPADSPVIVSKGQDLDGDFVWIVEMPIIMTYATNNNKKQSKKSIVRLTIARVPAKKNIAGIGIKSWRMM